MKTTCYKTIANTVYSIILLMAQATATAATNPAPKISNISEAMKLYSQALPLAINSPKRIELLDQAESILKEIIKNNPQSLDAHRKLLGVYLLKQDYRKGIRTVQDAITLSPKDPELFITLAFLYEHSGSLEYAKAMLNQALELDPNQKLAKQYKAAIQERIDAHQEEKITHKNDKKPDTASPHSPANAKK